MYKNSVFLKNNSAVCHFDEGEILSSYSDCVIPPPRTRVIANWQSNDNFTRSFRVPQYLFASPVF